LRKTSGVPEIIVVGLKEEMGCFVVNEYNSRVRAGEKFELNRSYSGFLGGFDVLFKEVHHSHYREHFGWDRWLYKGDDFKALQMMYPTTEGVWPWDEDASDWFKKRQPQLSESSLDKESNQPTTVH
jgi:hypothetical protein